MVLGVDCPVMAVSVCLVFAGYSGNNFPCYMIQSVRRLAELPVVPIVGAPVHALHWPHPVHWLATQSFFLSPCFHAAAALWAQAVPESPAHGQHSRVDEEYFCGICHSYQPFIK
jgi:hypothetical protein